MAPDPDSSLVDFVARFLADRAAGAELSLAQYLAIYPGREQAVEREHRRLCGEHEHTGRDAGPESSSPDRVGHYELVRELGRGGQGTVWLARDLVLDRLVALKVVPCSPLFEDLAPRFRREARVTSRLEHQGICPVHEVGSDGTLAWIAMRYVEGSTLAARIAEDPERKLAPLARRLEWIERVANALHAAHEAGVIHRDVKPANVMITPTDEPVLLDFGIARDEEASQQLTLLAQTLGTPAYASPEQLGGDPASVDRRSDVWSLGVTLHEALTGERPFVAATREALAREVLEGQPADPRRAVPEVSKDLSVIVATALAKDPNRRYASAQAMAEDLRRLRSHEPILARPASARERLTHWARRNRALAASLFTLGVVLVAALAISLDLLTRTRRSLADVTRLSDQRLVLESIAAAGELWPAAPEMDARFAAWTRAADELLSRRELHERALAKLRAGRPARTSEPTSAQDAWFEDLLTILVGDLDRLAAARASVVARRERAAALERRTLEQPAQGWREAAGRVAADARFAGVTLTPQRGLVPLGPDPLTGLEEFVLLESGEPPARDPESGRLQPSNASGVVLVLLPAVRIATGCEPPSPDRPAGSPNVDPDDGPIQVVDLDPFFVSKYEMTQGQWTRHRDENPSYFGYGSRHLPTEEADSHPVELITWVEAQRVCNELELELPTEAQWEYAARGGSSSPWFCGDDRRCLDGAANLADTFARENGGSQSWGCEEWLDDGATAHAAVGSYRPNGLGLHDTAGNVSELCLDSWETWSEVAPPRPGDGLRVGDEVLRCVRGGSFAEDAHDARCGARGGLPDDLRAPYVGLRPARRLSLD